MKKLLIDEIVNLDPLNDEGFSRTIKPVVDFREVSTYPIKIYSYAADRETMRTAIIRKTDYVIAALVDQRQTIEKDLKDITQVIRKLRSNCTEYRNLWKKKKSDKVKGHDTLRRDYWKLRRQYISLLRSTKDNSFVDIAEKMGITPGRVRQIFEQTVSDTRRAEQRPGSNERR